MTWYWLSVMQELAQVDQQGRNRGRDRVGEGCHH